ncbi:hypothetical protein U1Q18_021216, partial [Sarracenia purpurea var. burkii]
QQEVQTNDDAPVSFPTGVDSNYLPALMNVENMVAMDEQFQSCNTMGMNEERDDEMALEYCLQRKELNEYWVESSQHCPSFLLWDLADEEPLVGEEIAPSSSNLGTLLSSYPSSL